jgi:photosystem II stability/assembly factor-like uncharacterized protein
MRTRRLAAAAVVIALLASGCAAREQRPRAVISATPRPPLVASEVVGAPVPRGFVPLSVTAVSPTTFWVLGTAPCRAQPCTSLVRTTDGGRSFVGLHAPVAGTPGGDGTVGRTTVTDVRFADTRDGWVYGGALFSTHDGGASWRRVEMPGPVMRLEAAAGTAWAIVGSGDTFSLYRSAIGTDAWVQVTLPATLVAPPPDLALAGRQVIVLDNASSPGRLLVSTDGGTTFEVRSSGCDGGLGGSLSPAAGALWMVCPTGTLASLLRSPAQPLSFAFVDHPPMPNSAMVGAVGLTTAVLAIGGRLERTDDAGAHWIPVTSSVNAGQFRFVGFTTPAVGYALRTIPDQALLRTTDGGLTWTVVSFAM